MQIRILTPLVFPVMAMRFVTTIVLLSEVGEIVALPT
jgi:hypothetical protein